MQSATHSNGWIWALQRAPFIVFAILLAWVTFAPPYANKPPIRSDGVGYHRWTYAILRGDLNFAKLIDKNGENGCYLADPKRGFWHNKYPPGVALVRLPVMFWCARPFEDPPTISAEEHEQSLVLGAVALVCIVAAAMCTCYYCLELTYGSSALATFAIVFGTGLFHYATYDSSFSHIYSALGFSSLLFIGIHSLHQDEPRLPPLSTALVVALLVLIRGTNMVAIGMLALAYIWQLRRQHAFSIRACNRALWPIAAGSIVGAGILVALNSYASGRLTFSSYAGESFDWDRPMALSVLFSPNHGLFIYYPVLAVTLVGGLIDRRTRAVAFQFGCLLVVYAFLYGFWHCWWLGGSFGHRGFVELAPLAVPLLASVLANSTGIRRWLLIVAVVLSVLITVEMLLGYWAETLAGDANTWSEYFDHLLGAGARAMCE